MNSAPPFIITTVVWTHKLVVFFIYLGCLLPKRYLKYHIGFLFLLYLHWKSNKNKCILTELEYRLQGKQDTSIPTIEYDHDNPFIDRILQDMGIKLTSQQIHSIAMYGIVLSLCISFIRICRT